MLLPVDDAEYHLQALSDVPDACSSQSLMRRRIAASLVRCSVVITAFSVRQFSARSESWAAYTLWITDHAWVVSSGLRKPRAMAVSRQVQASPK
jgi:hypothetical protein